jgi:catechol 2,3-dioxygenase-like lactoylglutathione lyase family enzyme
MPHGLDHIVHAVRDLDAAAEFYLGAGFTVGAQGATLIFEAGRVGRSLGLRPAWSAEKRKVP